MEKLKDFTEQQKIGLVLCLCAISILGVSIATSGYDWGEGTHAVMRADSWKWIKPITMKGFQGWRYHNANGVKIVGSWLDPKPVIGDVK